MEKNRLARADHAGAEENGILMATGFVKLCGEAFAQLVEFLTKLERYGYLEIRRRGR